MRLFAFIFVTVILISCDNNSSKNVRTPEVLSEEIVEDSRIPTKVRKAKKVDLYKDYQLVSLEEIEMIPTPKDSILYHISYAIDEATVLAVAQPMPETFEGVRLQLLSRKKDKIKLLDSSSPGYDSPQLYPTFFKNEDGHYIILANTGVNDSWGVKVYTLIDNQFSDVGFIDMAVVEKREFPDDNGRMDRYTNISKETIITSKNGALNFSFNGNKLILFDDNNGEHDVKFKPNEFYYTFDNKAFTLHSN